MHISITGRLGSGKSTVAKLLAASEDIPLYIEALGSIDVVGF